MMECLLAKEAEKLAIYPYGNNICIRVQNWIQI